MPIRETIGEAPEPSGSTAASLSCRDDARGHVSFWRPPEEVRARETHHLPVLIVARFLTDYPGRLVGKAGHG